MNKKALRVVALLFAFTLMVTGFNVTTETVSAAPKKPTTIKLNATSKTLYVGQTTTLEVKSVKPSNANKSVTWTTNNSKVATVKNGKVTAKKAGKATITAVSKYNKKAKATCKVTVKNPTTTFTKSSLTVNAADKTDLSKYLKVEGKSKTVTWTTSNKKIATVSKSGKVTFKKAGTVTITAKANGKSAKIKVTAPELTISKTTATIWFPAQKSITLTAKAYTATGKKSSIKWTSSNDKIATVKNGKVTFKKLGTVKITASANGLKKTCTITAKEETIKLNKKEVSLYPTQSYTLKATVAGRSNKVTWKSSKESVATVKDGKVTAHKAGTATITATANGKTATCKVTVNKATLTLDKINVTLFVTETATVKATVTGASKTVTWTTGNDKVATVVNGVITATGEGTTTITATANGVTATCNVTVNAPTLTLDKENVILTVGETSKVTATVTGLDKTVTWTTGDDKVATVANGVITAIAKGATTVKATANGVTKTVYVTVKEASVTPPVEDPDKMVTFNLSKTATAYKVESLDRSYTVTQKDLLAKKEKAVAFAKNHGADMEAMFNAVAVEGRTYTVAGRTATVNKASNNTATITVTGVNGKVDGTYTVTIAKVAEGKYTVTVTNTASNKTRSLTVSVKLANGEYTFTTSELDYDFTLTVKADGTAAKLVAKNSAKEFTVATYEETETSYVAVYNRTFLVRNLQLALDKFQITSVTAQEIIDRLDATTVTELNEAI